MSPAMMRRVVPLTGTAMPSPPPAPAPMLATPVGGAQQETVAGAPPARSEALPAAPAAHTPAGIAPAGLGHPQTGHLAGELGRAPGDDLRVAVQWFFLWHASSYPGRSGGCG